MQTIQLANSQVLAMGRCRYSSFRVRNANATVLLWYTIVILLFCSNLLQLAASNDHVGVFLRFQVMNRLLQIISFLRRMAGCAPKCNYSFLWTLGHLEHRCLTFKEESWLVNNVICRCCWWVINSRSCASLLRYVLSLTWSECTGVLQNKIIMILICFRSSVSVSSSDCLLWRIWVVVVIPQVLVGVPSLSLLIHRLFRQVAVLSRHCWVWLWLILSRQLRPLGSVQSTVYRTWGCTAVHQHGGF